MLADFHMHSNLSDGSLPIRQLVDLYGGMGFGAIAITDHLCEQKTSTIWLSYLELKSQRIHF